MTQDRKAIALIIGAIAVAYADVIVLARGFYRADVISYHYPMKHVVRDVLFRGAFPYWNRFVSSGQPLAANPAYELWYPPQWLVFLPSFHYGFQLHIVLHFAIAAIGTYLVIRSFDGSIGAAIFGALAFAFSGPYVSLTSKLPLLFALSWMPLAAYFVRELLDEWRWSRFTGAAITLAMQLILGEPTIVIQTWALIVGYAIWRAVKLKSLRADATRIVFLGITAFLLAAVQLVPALDFARDTVRSHTLDFRIVSNWSMPLVRPFEMLMPAIFTQLKMMPAMYAFRSEPYIGDLYLGILIAVLAVAGILSGKRGSGIVLAVFAIAYVFAAGEHTPLLKLLYDAHLMRSVRYPEKFVLVAAFALIVWAALMFDRIRGDRALARNAVVVAVLAGLIAAMMAAATGSGVIALNVVRAIVVIALVGPLRSRLSPRVWTTVAITLTSLDLLVTLRGETERMPRDFFNAPALATSLPQTNEYRVFHEAAWDQWDQKRDALARTAGMTPQTYGGYVWSRLFPNLPELYGRQMTLEDDIDLTSLEHTDELREQLKSARRNGTPGAQSQLLKMSNVRWKIGAYGVEEIESWPRYAFADRVDRGYFRAEPSGLEKVAFADVDFQPSPGVVTSVHETDNSIALTTTNAGRGLLLISVTTHRYWRATIDGHAAPLIPANLAYQALDVPAGTHQIALQYRNPLILPSAIVSLLTLITLVALRAKFHRP